MSVVAKMGDVTNNGFSVLVCALRWVVQCRLADAGEGEKAVDVRRSDSGSSHGQQCSTSVGWDGVISELRFGEMYGSSSVV